jgi:hypothetical protein
MTPVEIQKQILKSTNAWYESMTPEKVDKLITDKLKQEFEEIFLVCMGMSRKWGTLELTSVNETKTEIAKVVNQVVLNYLNTIEKPVLTSKTKTEIKKIITKEFDYMCTSRARSQGTHLQKVADEYIKEVCSKFSAEKLKETLSLINND